VTATDADRPLRRFNSGSHLQFGSSGASTPTEMHVVPDFTQPGTGYVDSFLSVVLLRIFCKYHTHLFSVSLWIIFARKILYSSKCVTSDALPWRLVSWMTLTMFGLSDVILGYLLAYLKRDVSEVFYQWSRTMSSGTTQLLLHGTSGLGSATCVNCALEILLLKLLIYLLTSSIRLVFGQSRHSQQLLSKMYLLLGRVHLTERWRTEDLLPDLPVQFCVPPRHVDSKVLGWSPDGSPPVRWRSQCGGGDTVMVYLLRWPSQAPEEL